MPPRIDDGVEPRPDTLTTVPTGAETPSAPVVFLVGSADSVRSTVDPAVCTVEAYDSEAAWLDARRRGIGASEVAAVLGLSRYATPLTVWADKVGLAEGDPAADLGRVRWGKRLQPVIARGYAEESGRPVLDPGPWTLLRSVAYPWLTATPDYLVATREAPDPWRTPGVLEIKNAGEYTRGQWVEEPPLPYLVQLQAQILVSGFAWGVLAALLGGADLVFRDYVAHEGVAEWIVEDVAAFWACVQRGDPPRPLDGDAATTRALARLYPRPVPEKTIALPPAAAEWDRIIHDGDAEIKAITERVDAARNELRAAIGDAERGTLPDGSSWSYKLESRPEYTVHARELRVLRHGKRR